jgi:hypothetical protein
MLRRRLLVLPNECTFLYVLNRISVEVLDLG